MFALLEETRASVRMGSRWRRQSLRARRSCKPPMPLPDAVGPRALSALHRRSSSAVFKMREMGAWRPSALLPKRPELGRIGNPEDRGMRSPSISIASYWSRAPSRKIAKPQRVVEALGMNFQARSAGAVFASRAEVEARGAVGDADGVERCGFAPAGPSVSTTTFSRSMALSDEASPSVSREEGDEQPLTGPCRCCGARNPRTRARNVRPAAAQCLAIR